MYTSKFFLENKTVNHIQVALDRILLNAGLDAENIPCTTDKGPNMVAATKSKCYVNCAYHHQSTAFNTAWDVSCAQNEELKQLDDCANSLAKILLKT